jgi:hypothetical protein
MPARDIVQHILEGLTSLNPEAARQQQQRKNAADTLKQRLFSNSMEQQRMDLEKESAQRSQDHWDADQKYRADQEARQSKLDDANRQHNQLMEQMGLAQAGARPAAPDVTVPSLLPGTGNPPMTIPSMDAGRPTIQPSWSPTPMVLPTPEETGDTAGRVAAATAAAKGDEWSKEFEGRLSKLDPKWTTDPDNADKLNQLRA